VELSSHSAPLAIEVLKAEGSKCERCWKFKVDIGANAKYPTACASCVVVVEAWVG